MAELIELRPTVPRIGAPIFVVVHDPLSSKATQVTIRKQGETKKEFSVPLVAVTSFKEVGSDKIAEFQLMLPGVYDVLVGQESTTFQLHESVNLGFGKEFGLTLFFTVIMFFIILWKIGKRNSAVS